MRPLHPASFILLVTALCGLFFLTVFVDIPQVKAATDCAAQSDIPESECNALIALYTSTNGPNWTTNAGWDDTQFPCSWYGVFCSGGSVIDLSLSSNQLSGGIPAELGNLTNLNTLNLNINQLSGSIPPELGDLTNLNTLDLSNNQLRTEL